MADRLEDAIDRAVREMLDVEPPADLRARVIAQLPAAGSRLPAPGFRLPAPGFRLPASGSRLPASGSLFELVASAFRRNRVVFAVAVAALIVVALFVARRGEPLPKAPVVATAPDQHVAPAPLQRPGVDTAPLQRTPPVVRPAPSAPRATSPGTVVAASNRGDDPGASGIEPLSRIAPIAVTPIAHDSIAPAEIAVRPLNTITEVQITPLTPPDRR